MIRQNRIMLQVAGSDDLFWHDSALSRNRTKMFRDLGAVAPFEAVRGIEVYMCGAQRGTYPILESEAILMIFDG
jgi:hypothetical protein